MSYRNYFDIDPEYFPQVDKRIIDTQPDLWKKFYPHPSVGVILDNKYDYRLNEREKAFCNIVSIIVFIRFFSRNSISF